MKSIEEVAVWMIAGLIVSSICWLVKEVLSLRQGFTKLQTQVNLQVKSIMKNCNRHQKWGEEMQKSLHRIDRNIVAICSMHAIEHEEPPGEDVSFSNGDDEEDGEEDNNS